MNNANNLDELLEHYQNKIDFYKDQLTNCTSSLNKSLLQDKLNAVVSGYIALNKLVVLNRLDSRKDLGIVERNKEKEKVYKSQLM